MTRRLTPFAELADILDRGGGRASAGAEQRRVLLELSGAAWRQIEGEVVGG
jgi:hypothetical protein